MHTLNPSNLIFAAFFYRNFSFLPSYFAISSFQFSDQ